MAAAARRALRFAGAAGAWLALAIGLFMLAAWIGSSLPRNADWREPRQGVEIFVETNGIHTALVLPRFHPLKDWSADFPVRDLGDPTRPYTHVSISWGDREVFLNTPSWAELRPRTVGRILLGGGEGLVHAAHYVRPAPAADIRSLRLTPAQYRTIVRRIESLLPPPAERRAYPGYADYDAFYDARGRYTPANNCNQWTSDTLAAAGVRTGRWTPFAGGVMKWVGD